MSRPNPIKPRSGQESVWDYPRPPRLERVPKRIQIFFNGKSIADTTNAYRVLETSHPPVYYIPPEDIDLHSIRRAAGSSHCEWKGRASYFDVLVDGRRAGRAGWAYAQPTASFTPIKDHLAFYAGPMDACLVDGEKVRPQPGEFYGGWITKDIVGPFKGEPGSWGW